jgi:hypothetical protein
MTVRHVVTWRLAAEDPTTRAAHAAAVVEGLRSLLGVVTEIRILDAGVDVTGNGNWDVALIADFDDSDALARYQVHPAHVEVARFIRSVIANQTAVDFTV